MALSTVGGLGRKSFELAVLFHISESVAALSCSHILVFPFVYTCIYTRPLASHLRIDQAHNRNESIIYPSEI